MYLPYIIQFYLPIVANIAVIISVLVSVLIPLLSLRRKTKDNQDGVIITEVKVDEKDASTYNKIYSSTVGVSYAHLKKLYQNTHRQSNTWFIFSGIAESISILVIASVFIFPPSTYYSSVTVPITITILGVVLNIIAISTFFLARQKNQIIDEYCSAKFLEADQISNLISLIAEYPDAEARDRFKNKIISQILLDVREQENTSV